MTSVITRSTIPQFSTKAAENVGEPNTIIGMSKHDAYAVKYLDEEGKPRVSLVLHAPGGTGLLMLKKEAFQAAPALLVAEFQRALKKVNRAQAQEEVESI